MSSDIIKIAIGLNKIYNDVFQLDMDEMKMHKLLYFAQKNHFKTFGEWLFEEDQEGWVHGPVNREVRSKFDFIRNFDDTIDNLTLKEEYTIRETVHEYGEFTSWQLREMSHDDEAYKISRSGLSDNQNGNRIIDKKDIIRDIVLNLPVNDDCEVLQ